MTPLLVACFLAYQRKTMFAQDANDVLGCANREGSCVSLERNFQDFCAGGKSTGVGSNQVQELPLHFGSLRPLCRLRRRNRVIPGKMPPNASFLNRVRQQATSAHKRSKRGAKASTSTMSILPARPHAVRQARMNTQCGLTGSDP